jgi:FkbM family methyltransferase
MKLDVSFTCRLANEILQSENNNHNDNWDYFRYGPCPKRSFFDQINILYYRLFLKWRDPNRSQSKKKLINLSEQDELIIDSAEWLYYNLEDDYSKSLLVKLVAYRILGHRRIKLPLSNEFYFDSVNQINASEVPHTPALKNDVKQYNFKYKNIGRLLYLKPRGINATFGLRQYEYNHVPKIKANKGDCVIDAGGCWGDTALYFASKVGKSGKVYSFEFVPENIDIFNKNMQLNQVLSKSIELVKLPLGSKVGERVYFSDQGPGTRLSHDIGTESNSIKTTTIDAEVRKRKIKKVDFIKMDIEGSELASLIGAKKTLIRDRPKLALALYHKPDDFLKIPNYLMSLNLNYKFYLDHFSINHEETILFAK